MYGFSRGPKARRGEVCLLKEMIETIENLFWTLRFLFIRGHRGDVWGLLNLAAARDAKLYEHVWAVKHLTIFIVGCE